MEKSDIIICLKGKNKNSKNYREAKKIKNK